MVCRYRQRPGINERMPFPNNISAKQKYVTSTEIQAQFVNSVLHAITAMQTSIPVNNILNIKFMSNIFTNI